MMNKFTLVLAGLGLAAIAACKDSVGIDGNASAADRADILGAVDQSGYAGEDFGASGTESDFQLASLAGSLAGVAPEAVSGTVTLPALWGVRHGRPTLRTRTVTVQDDTATVDISLEFDTARFIMIVPQSGASAQTVTKVVPLAFSQSLRLVKNDSVNTADTTGLRSHKWKIIQVSPQNWQLKDVSKRTTNITRVRVLVNGTLKIEVTDPSQLYDVNNKMPRLHRGDVVQVQAEVSNTANTGNTPPTFAFLHVMHADLAGLGWRRIAMQDLGSGQFQISWVVRLPGRDRLVVQAIDSQTFQTDTGADARGNAWAIPYRIE